MTSTPPSCSIVTAASASSTKRRSTSCAPTWRSAAAPATGFGRNFQGVIAVGGRADFQEIRQTGLTFRNNLTFADFEWNGNHVFKVGAKLSLQKYRGRRQRAVRQSANSSSASTPTQGLDFDASRPRSVSAAAIPACSGQDDPDRPVRAGRLGGQRSSDAQSRACAGTMIPTPRTTISKLRRGRRGAADAGRRSAHPAVLLRRRGLHLDGDNRKADLNNFRRASASPTTSFADQRTVFFGGYGRYYDRALFRNAAEETLLSPIPPRQSAILARRPAAQRPADDPVQSGLSDPRGVRRVARQPCRRSDVAGHQRAAGHPERSQDAYTDQFSVGVRQRIGVFRTSLTYNFIRRQEPDRLCAAQPRPWQSMPAGSSTSSR